MNLFDRMLTMFGVEQMPWVIRVYLLLFLVVLGMLIYSAANIPVEFAENAHHPLQRMFEFSLDLLKIILGALLGSLSWAASHLWGKPTRSSAQTSDSEVSE